MAAEPSAFNVGEFVGGIAAGTATVLAFVVWLVRYLSSLNRKMQRVEGLLRAWGGTPTPDPLGAEEITSNGRWRRRSRD